MLTESNLLHGRYTALVNHLNPKEIVFVTI